MLWKLAIPMEKVGRGEETMKVKGFNHITLNVRNLDSTLSFYSEVLGMNIRHKGRRDAYLEWGTAWICIVEEPFHHEVDSRHLGMDHVAFFIEEEDFDEAVKILKERQVNIVREVIQRGKGRAINFVDVNGIEFELHTSTLDERMKVWK